MSRSVRTTRRRAGTTRRQTKPIDPTAANTPADPAAPIDPTAAIDLTAGMPPVFEPPLEGGDGRRATTSLRWSRAVAGLLLRSPLLRRLDDRLGPLIDQGRLDRTDALAGLLRFAMMGSLATAVYFTVAVGLHQTGLGPNLTSAIAVTVSVIVSFVAQSRITFRSGRFDWREGARFVAVGLVGLTVSRVVIGAVHLSAGQPFWLAALVVCLVIPITNFAAMNFWVFARGRDRP